MLDLERLGAFASDGETRWVGVSTRGFHWCLIAKSRKGGRFWAILGGFTNDGEAGHGRVSKREFHWCLVARSTEAKGTRASTCGFRRHLVARLGEVGNMMVGGGIGFNGYFSVAFGGGLCNLFC